MLTKKKELFIYIFFSSLLSLGAIFNKGVINTACKILFVRSKIDQAIEKKVFSAKSWNLEVKGVCSKCF